ncbi:MAG: S41 family peptidase [Caldimicrobium sp.]|nr:S41 family peptidase [Caldimicrobium sp.]MCX7613259.1 S41 family peptidase [Caldimicrobium sp.]MDW8182058.1 S41 family peptidase [Caldimicrobium sp.]
MNYKKKLFLGLFLGFTLFFLFSQALSLEKKEDTFRALKLFSQIFRLVEENYVTEINPKDLILGAIEGMLTSLDPHSSLMKPEEFKELEIETKGSFTGIGIEITIKDDVITVVAPIEDTPAWKAGIRPGDKILKIDEKSTKGMKITEAVKLLRGPKGTKVKITILRNDKDISEITLIRDVIPIRSVRAKVLETGYAYVRISQFQEKTREELVSALKQLEKETPLKGIILDLRNNPGGLLSSAVEVSDEFLENGTIVSIRGKSKANQMEFKAQPNPPDRKHRYPIVILINHGSASAAEIVTGALKDHKRALVLGEKSFGKGSVQTVIPIEDNYAVRLTTALYYTPNDVTIHKQGIQPDIELPSSDLPSKRNGKQDREAVFENRTSRFFSTPEEDFQVKMALNILKNIKNITQLKY